MKNSKDRFLTTHVGSMIRPQRVQDFNQAAASGQGYDRAAHMAALREDVAEVVKNQANSGVDVISDGEFGKSSWTAYIIGRLSGFEVREIERPRVGFRGWDAEGRFKEYYQAQPLGLAPTRQAVCVGPVTYTEEGKAQMRRDVEHFKAALQNVNVEEAFLPVVAPCSISTNYRNEYYKSDEEFLFAVAEAMHEEYKIIIDAGLLLQTDDAILANLHDPVVESGKDYRAWVDMNLSALNHALEGIPEDRVRYHLCWGS